MMIECAYTLGVELGIALAAPTVLKLWVAFAITGSFALAWLLVLALAFVAADVLVLTVLTLLLVLKLVSVAAVEFPLVRARWFGL